MYLKTIIAIVLICSLALSFCSCTRMTVHEIPTGTEKLATIKLHEGWRFTTENGRIHIKDGEKTVAREVYNEWRINYYLNGEYHDNKSELNINAELPDDLRNLDNYHVIQSDYYSADIFDYNIGGSQRYAVYLTIMRVPERNGAHVLFIVFEEDYSDLDVIQKILKSYTWAGYVNVADKG